MKALQPIYGQTYIGYYLNALNEEREISGVCKSYHGTPVLVNERGEWVPFEKLSEESYLTPPFVEPRLRESVRRFLREEIDREKFLDKLESLSDDEQEELMTSLLTTVEADAENAEENGEIVADEVATEIESWIEGEDVAEEADTNVSDDVEESVGTMVERRLREATYTNITNYLKKILKSDGVNGPALVARLEREATNGWKTLVGTVQPPTASEKNDMREVLRAILDKAAIADAKDPNEKLKQRAKESLQALLDYIHMGVTIEDIEAMEPQLSPSSSNSELYDAVAGEDVGTRRKK